MVRAGRAEEPASSARSAEARSAKRSRSFRLFVSARTRRPVSGSTSHSRPTSTSSLLARVTDLDRDDAPRAQLGQLGAEVEAGAEVGDEDDERAALRQPADARERLAEGGRAGALLERFARSVVRSVVRPGRPCFGGSARRREPPNVTIPRRLPRRVAALPIARATPSATSAFRRSAVPNVMEGETSRTSQVVSVRSATWTRTCGSPVRAVAFQSMRRTSSPTT